MSKLNIDSKDSGFAIKYWIHIPNSNVLFNHLAKNAGTSILNSISNFYDLKPLEIFNHRLKDKEYSYNLLKSEKYKKFTVIRNPLDRFLSAFNDKVLINSHEPYFSKFNKKYLHVKDINEKLNLFLNFITENNFSKYDIHIRPQYMLVSSESINYNLILKVDNLHNDWNKVREILNIDLAKPKFANKSNSVRLKNSISSDLIQRINNLYSEDIKFYNNN